MGAYDPGGLEDFAAVVPEHIVVDVGNIYAPERQEIHRDHVHAVVFAELAGDVHVDALVIHIVRASDQNDPQLVFFLDHGERLFARLLELQSEIRLRRVCPPHGPVHLILRNAEGLGKRTQLLFYPVQSAPEMDRRGQKTIQIGLEMRGAPEHIRQGLSPRAHVRFCIRIVRFLVEHVGMENIIHLLVEQVLDVPVRHADRITRLGHRGLHAVVPNFAIRGIRQHHLEAQLGKKGRPKRQSVVHIHTPRQSDLLSASCILLFYFLVGA